MFERGIAMIGWRQTMVTFAVVEALAVVPLAICAARTAGDTTVATTASIVRTTSRAPACRQTSHSQ